MVKKPGSLPVEVRFGLRKLGADIRRARLARRIPMALLADRVQVSRLTLAKVEQGAPTVAIGTYATVLWALGMGSRLRELVDPETDPVGRGLEEDRLPTRAFTPSLAQQKRGRLQRHRSEEP